MAEEKLIASDLRKLEHMLGAGPSNPRRNWGYRNHYATSGGEPMEAMRRLESMGLVAAGHRSGSMTFSHATESGCREVGLDAKQIKRALEE